jgi:hypothetical protein
VYSNEAVKRFGRAYRKALRDSQDYASLIDLENAETGERLAEALRRFLRRNHKAAQEKHWFWPADEHLEDVMALAEENVALVRAAIESYALLWEPSQQESSQEEG